MNKSDLIKYGAVLIVLIFMFELFAINMIGRSSTEESESGPRVSTGSAQFDVVLRSYEPYLIVASLNETQVAFIKSLPDVEGVTASGTGFIISLKSSSVVTPTYRALSSSGLTAYAVANIQFPNTIDILLANGSSETIITNGGIAQMDLEPYFDAGELLSVRSQQLNAQDGILYTYSLPSIAPVKMLINITGRIDSALYDELQFSIPWEQRGTVDVAALAIEFGPENVSYETANSISLPQPLSNEEMISKKYDYVEYISESSITTSVNFTNKTRIYEDFGNITLPSSYLLLVVPYNRSVDVGHVPAVSTYYKVVLSSDNYSFSDDWLEASLQNVSVGDEVTLESSVTLIGKRIKSVDSARKA